MAKYIKAIAAAGITMAALLYVIGDYYLTERKLKDKKDEQRLVAFMAESNGKLDELIDKHNAEFVQQQGISLENGISPLEVYKAAFDRSYADIPSEWKLNDERFIASAAKERVPDEIKKMAGDRFLSKTEIEKARMKVPEMYDKVFKIRRLINAREYTEN